MPVKAGRKDTSEDVIGMAETGRITPGLFEGRKGFTKTPKGDIWDFEKIDRVLYPNPGWKPVAINFRKSSCELLLPFNGEEVLGPALIS